MYNNLPTLSTPSHPTKAHMSAFSLVYSSRNTNTDKRLLLLQRNEQFFDILENYTIYML